ncbi:unnamed protein product [Vitrella brassicaformis CCMP3155]|uniref:Uncharacterized protein n=1 Tax=Vitrella brassicaformis (strain CCMP3155) TaxID=1169540 RepID=A0A0G4GM54_VITBC|nr:unnamed protein product [Vitrella brassicaformis CCMP3155]|eukprot:CEM31250.1 unnamed protein product [Vitrella brassicaformis CCMP3155]
MTIRRTTMKSPPHYVHRADQPARQLTEDGHDPRTTRRMSTAHVAPPRCLSVNRSAPGPPPQPIIGAGGRISRPALLCALHDNWAALKLDHHRSPSRADPLHMTAPPEYRYVWLTAASTELIMGQPGWAIALLPAAINEGGRPRTFRNLYRLQVFRRPAKYMDEAATTYSGQCGVFLYRGGQLVDAPTYVPVTKSKGDKLCATCVAWCAKTGRMCGKQNTYRNVVNSHLRKTHKLTEDDLQGCAALPNLTNRAAPSSDDESPSPNVLPIDVENLHGWSAAPAAGCNTQGGKIDMELV